MSPSSDAIPVTLLTGFLGSGKTTLLQGLLRQRPHTAVVMNEFGEVGLDDGLLEHTEGPLALLSGGCVCCQVQGSLAPTLKNLWMARAEGKVPPFKRVVIETTGVADPAPILDTLTRERWIARHYRVDAIVTTVDAQFGLSQLEAHPEARRQVAVADRLLLTKTDLVPQETAAALEARLARLNPSAPVTRVCLGGIDAAQVLDLDAFEPLRPLGRGPWLAAERYPSVAAPGAGLTAHVPAQHTGGIRAFSLVFDTPLEWTGVQAALQMLSAFRGRNLLRFKAILNLAGEALPVALHGVQHMLYPPVRLPAWPDDDRRSRFVFITHDLDEAFVARVLRDFTQAAGAWPGIPSQAGLG